MSDDIEWVVYTLDADAAPGRFLAVAESWKDARAAANRWWKAFHTGAKVEPDDYCGVSWGPVADFEQWKDGPTAPSSPDSDGE